MHLLIAAAGSGSRMGASCNKLLIELLGRPLLAWTLDSAIAAESIEWIGIIGRAIDKPLIMRLVESCNKPVKWIEGGETRQESVQRGLAGLPSAAKYVLIHDGARCLVEPGLFNKCAELVTRGEAVIAATPVIDTIKHVNSEGFITNTPDRSGLWAAQTPQGFSVRQLSEGHRQAIANDWVVTDDASLYERLGWGVKVLKSDPSNLKITTPFDLSIAAAILSSREIL